jgi:hypothetical protein
MLVAVARCKSSPPTYTRAGGSRTPPMPQGIEPELSKSLAFIFSRGALDTYAR